jgi:hypothetical protein
MYSAGLEQDRNRRAAASVGAGRGRAAHLIKLPVAMRALNAPHSGPGPMQPLSSTEIYLIYAGIKPV